MFKNWGVLSKPVAGCNFMVIITWLQRSVQQQKRKQESKTVTSMNITANLKSISEVNDKESVWLRTKQ